jgi:hypothetical protein
MAEKAGAEVYVNVHACKAAWAVTPGHRGRDAGCAGAAIRRPGRLRPNRRSSYPLRTAAGSVDPAFPHGFPRAKSQRIDG